MSRETVESFPSRIVTLCACLLAQFERECPFRPRGSHHCRIATITCSPFAEFALFDHCDSVVRNVCESSAQLVPTIVAVSPYLGGLAASSGDRSARLLGCTLISDADPDDEPVLARARQAEPPSAGEAARAGSRRSMDRCGQVTFMSSTG
jgi:hypothetical protein